MLSLSEEKFLSRNVFNCLYFMIELLSFVIQDLVSSVITRPSESPERDLIFSKEERG